jgi:hypothetical protein
VIDHTGLQISDPVVSRKFYDNALAPLGYTMMFQVPVEHTGGAAVFGYGVPPKADFWVSEGKPNSPNLHIAFRAATRSKSMNFIGLPWQPAGKTTGVPGYVRTITRIIMGPLCWIPMDTISRLVATRRRKHRLKRSVVFLYKNRPAKSHTVWSNAVPSYI